MLTKSRYHVKLIGRLSIINNTTWWWLADQISLMTEELFEWHSAESGPWHLSQKVEQARFLSIQMYFSLSEENPKMRNKRWRYTWWRWSMRGTAMLHCSSCHLCFLLAHRKFITRDLFYHATLSSQKEIV